MSGVAFPTNHTVIYLHHNTTSWCHTQQNIHFNTYDISIVRYIILFLPSHILYFIFNSNILSRALADNWSIDIARELEDYLGELEKISFSFDGESNSLNFAEGTWGGRVGFFVYTNVRCPLLSVLVILAPSKSSSPFHPLHPHPLVLFVESTF